MAARWRIAAGLAAVLVRALTAAAAGDDPAARIEQHRKGDAVVRVVDAAGQPVAGAEVEIRQTGHAFLFGCNIFLWGKLPDPALEAAYRERFASVFNYATLPFYWWSYEREEGRPMHARTEELARWCRDRGIQLKGHPLAWNYIDPPWLKGEPAAVTTRQLARIDDCVRRFRGLVDRWDVVNEMTHYDREELLRRAPALSNAIRETGPVAFTRACFLAARRADPAAVLLINDYRTDRGYERVIEQLVDPAGRPLYDVIGIQSHMHDGAWPTERIREVCGRFARFGRPLHFTEMTLLSGDRAWEHPQPWPSTPGGEAWQAREFERIYTALFAQPAVEAITWWDFADRGAWKRAPAGLLRDDLSPKPSFEVLHRLVNETWRTRLREKTGADGRVAFRGFLGPYAVAASLDGRTAAGTCTLDREAAASLVLTLAARGPAPSAE